MEYDCNYSMLSDTGREVGFKRLPGFIEDRPWDVRGSRLGKSAERRSGFEPDLTATVALLEEEDANDRGEEVDDREDEADALADRVTRDHATSSQVGVVTNLQISRPTCQRVYSSRGSP